MSKDHVWLASYPETAPAEIDTTQYASVACGFHQDEDGGSVWASQNFR